MAGTTSKGRPKEAIPIAGRAASKVRRSVPFFFISSGSLISQSR